MVGGESEYYEDVEQLLFLFPSLIGAATPTPQSATAACGFFFFIHVLHRFVLPMVLPPPLAMKHAEEAMVRLKGDRSSSTVLSAATCSTEASASAGPRPAASLRDESDSDDDERCAQCRCLCGGSWFLRDDTVFCSNDCRAANLIASCSAAAEQDAEAVRAGDAADAADAQLTLSCTLARR
jgi:hypothetical protein